MRIYLLIPLFLYGCSQSPQSESHSVESTAEELVENPVRVPSNTEISEPDGAQSQTQTQERDYTFSTRGSLVQRSKQYKEGGLNRKHAIQKLADQSPIPETHFRVQTDCDTVIRGREGTLFFIEAHCFRDEEGAPIEGEVDIILQEFYDYASMLHANLTTTAQGTMLETAGMFSVNAYQEGKKLQIRNGYSVMVSPPHSIDPDFDLYFAEWTQEGEVDWHLDTQAKEEPKVICPKGGKYAEVQEVKQYFVSHYRLPHSTLKGLKDTSWLVNMNVYNGKFLGSGGDSKQSNQLLEAIDTFQSIASDFYNSLNNKNILSSIERNTQFDFYVTTRSELLFLEQNATFLATFKGFKSQAKVYKTTGKAAMFSLNALGTFNFDRIPVLKDVIEEAERKLQNQIKTIEIDQGPRRVVQVSQNQVSNPLKIVIILADIHALLPTRFQDHVWVAEGIPKKSYGKVLVTSVQEGRYILGIGTLPQGDQTTLTQLDEVRSFDSAEDYNHALKEVANAVQP